MEARAIVTATGGVSRAAIASEDGEVMIAVGRLLHQHPRSRTTPQPHRRLVRRLGSKTDPESVDAIPDAGEVQSRCAIQSRHANRSGHTNSNATVNETRSGLASGSGPTCRSEAARIDPSRPRGDSEKDWSSRASSGQSPRDRPKQSPRNRRSRSRKFRRGHRRECQDLPPPTGLNLLSAPGTRVRNGRPSGSSNLAGRHHRFSSES
jgi:hypothetical protein